MNINIQNSNIETILLRDLVQQKRIEMKRGKVIAKTTGKYPVYSSSIKNNGLMCYSDEYMFDEELISWSVDGGGNFFYRPKHKYSLTNVSGYIRVLDKNINCKYLYCILSLLHSKEHFDYTTKAHPNVICKMYKIPLPNIEIQEKIATILFELENKVIKQEQIITKLKEAKQSFLELLFPNNNSGIPQLRFENFTNDWEQRKLSDISKKITRKNTNNESDLPLTISSQYGLIDQNTFFNKRIASRDVSNYYLLFNGEFAYNKSSSDGYPFGSVKRLDLYDKGVLSTLYIVFDIKNKEEIDSDFLTIFFETDRWYKGVSERATEGARNHGLLNISAEDFLDINLFIPKAIQEQKEIATYFNNLNSLITLHQRKLDKLKEVKSALLDKLLV